MSLRDTLNQNPAITTGATAAIIVIALIWIFYSSFAGGAGGGAAQMYISADDGATFVAEDAEKRYDALTVNGKEAVFAHVFSADGGKTKTVEYLERYSPEALKVLREQRKQMKEGKMPAVSPLDPNVVNGLEVKKPKAAKWVKANSPEGLQVVTVAPEKSEVFPD